MTDNIYNEKEVQKADCHKDNDPSSKFQDELNEHRSHCFKGLNLGIIKLGVEGDSLAFGVNVGVAKLDTQVGQETRVDAGVGLGPVGAKAGGGVGFNRDGIHADAAAKARVTDAVKTGAELGANIGPLTGAEAGMHAKIGDLIHTKQEAGSSISRDGFNSAYSGDIGVGKRLADLKTDAHANLNDNSSLGVGARASVRDASIGAGADIATDGNRLVRPDVHVNADRGSVENRAELGAQVGPKLDARIGAGYSHLNEARDTGRLGAAAFGVGQSGVGFKAVELKDDDFSIHTLGAGRDYKSDKW